MSFWLVNFEDDTPVSLLCVNGRSIQEDLSAAHLLPMSIRTCRAILIS